MLKYLFPTLAESIVYCLTGFIHQEKYSPPAEINAAERRGSCAHARIAISPITTAFPPRRQNRFRSLAMLSAGSLSLMRCRDVIGDTDERIFALADGLFDGG